jgi:hypothetical protein
MNNRRSIEVRSVVAYARRVLNTPVWGTVRPRATRARRNQGGFVYLLALFAVILLVAGTLVVLEKGATEARRRREEEMIWRGNQYVRAIRMYYKKTGHYPQTLDDLNKGLPQLHFLRQPYKDPTNTADGSWRFIYINGAGQIIGSTKYANLQQMALMDQNGGQLPVIPGQAGQSVASIAQQQAGIDPNTGQPIQQNGQSMTPSNGQPQYNSDGSAATTTDAFGNQVAAVTGDGSTPTPPPANPSNPNLPAGLANITPAQIQEAIQSGNLPPGVSAADVQNFLSTGQIPANIDPAIVSAVQNALANAQNSGAAPTSAGSGFSFSNPNASGGLPSIAGQPGTGLSGLGNIAGPSALANTQANLAAMAMLKPTGAVDGPVLGGFLTGVAGKMDVDSIKKYRGAKKLKQFEFIWNPLEDAAAALQNQLGGTQGNILGQGSSSASPNGNSSGASSFGIGGLTSPNSPQQTPQQQNPPSTPQQ